MSKNESTPLNILSFLQLFEFFDFSAFFPRDNLPAIAFKALFGSEEFVARSVQERIRANRPEHRKAKVRDHLPFTVAGSVKLTEGTRIDLGNNTVKNIVRL